MLYISILFCIYVSLRNIGVKTNLIQSDNWFVIVYNAIYLCMGEL